MFFAACSFDGKSSRAIVVHWHSWMRWSFRLGKSSPASDSFIWTFHLTRHFMFLHTLSSALLRWSLSILSLRYTSSCASCVLHWRQPLSCILAPSKANLAADTFSLSRRTSILPSDCHSSYILYLKKKEQILYDDFIESELRIDCLAHPALIIRKETHKPSHVRICIVCDNQHSPIWRAELIGISWLLSVVSWWTINTHKTHPFGTTTFQSIQIHPLLLVEPN